MDEGIAYADLNIREIYSFATAPHPCPGSSAPQCPQWYRVALGGGSVVILLLIGVVIILAIWVLQSKGTECLPECEFRLQLKHFACSSPGNSTEENIMKCKICPQDWKLHGESCYWFSKQSKNWAKSQEDCGAKNSTLVVIQNEEEKDWKLHGESCYWFSKQSKNWAKSQEDCGAKNSTLVVIQNEEEKKFIDNATTTHVWLGLIFKLSENRTWKWVDGSPLKKDLFVLEGPAEENSCVMKRDNRFNSEGCDSSNHWICEKTALQV